MLVVLAESPEHARQVVADAQAAQRRAQEETAPALQDVFRRMNALRLSTGKDWAPGGVLRATSEGKALIAEQDAILARQGEYIVPDGSPKALDREPDRVVELYQATVVAFNGGGVRLMPGDARAAEDRVEGDGR